jgi:hypothetical protein
VSFRICPAPARDPEAQARGFKLEYRLTHREQLADTVAR